MKRFLPILLCAVAHVAGAQAPPPAAVASHGLTVDDILAVKQVHDISVSPDGQTVAMVVIPSWLEGLPKPMGMPYGGSRGDVWLVSRRTGERHKITSGLEEGTGFMDPVWSPDGKRIAMLSTKGGDNLRAYVWERSTNKLTRLSESGIAYASYVNATDIGSRSHTVRWIDASTIVVAVTPSGEYSPLFVGEHEGMTRAAKEWQKWAGGKEVTASVLESAQDTMPPSLAPKVQLITINVVTRATHVLADGHIDHLWISPDNRHAVVAEDLGPVPADPTKPIRWTSQRRSRLGVVALTSTGAVHWVDGLVPNMVESGEDHDHWSPDGKRYAVLGKLHQADDAAGTIWMVDVDAGTTRRLLADTMQVASVAWTADNQLLASIAPPPNPNAAPLQPGEHDTTRVGRSDWWLVGADGATRKLTASMKHVPFDLRPARSGATAIGLVDGSLWMIDAASATATMISTPDTGHINRIVWPKGDAALSEHGDLLLGADRRSATFASWYRAVYHVALDGDGHGAHADLIARPDEHANFAAYDPAKNVALFTTSGPRMVTITSARGTGAFDTLLTLNAQLKSVVLGKASVIRYRGTEGDSLKAYVTLPLDYVPGKRYPVVTWVYAGSIRRDSVAPEVDLTVPLIYTMELLAAHGYVVLEPSMPLGPEGVAGDPMIDLPKGVIAAVDKLVEMGIADPKRIGVMGHSYGGYSTYSLIAYTNRFKAAVAMAGPADLSSGYGTLFAESRYNPTVVEESWFPGWSESGQGRMGGPPYANQWHYWRNSPINFIDRINTPVLIVQGDQDMVSMMQGEQMFSGLNRLGKRARFVRYWGEGHTVESPANARDLWKRIFDWFDTYLGAKPTP